MSARVVSRRTARVGGGVPREQIVEIQRSRLLAAAVAAVDELGYADTTVSDVTSRARVSRRTFYELFSSREECLATVLEDVVALIGAEIAAAGLEGLAWRERVRGGLCAILSFLDREPALARVCVVQALRGGAEVLERREEILARLAAVVDEGRVEAARGGQCTPLTAEGVVGAAFAIVYARLLRGEMEQGGATATLLPGGWATGAASPLLTAAAHGFAWLRDLREIGSPAALLRARALVAEWIATPPLEPIAHRPDVTGARIAASSRASSMRLSSSSKNRRSPASAVARSCASP